MRISMVKKLIDKPIHGKIWWKPITVRNEVFPAQSLLLFIIMLMKRKLLHCWKNTKKYIVVRRRHMGTQKMVKDWLRKFRNIKIEIWQYIFDRWRPNWQKKNQFEEEKSKIKYIFIYIYIYIESIRFCWKINWVYEGFDCNKKIFLSQFRL